MRKKKEEISKNELAERICGLRDAGNHANLLFEPWELDYECPICHTKAFKKENPEYFNEITSIHWSEYRGFLYCPKCNIDIPSYFCLIPDALNSKEKVEGHVKNYLQLISEYQKHVLKEEVKDNLTLIQYQAQVEDLKKEVIYYKNFTGTFHNSVSKWYLMDLNTLGKQKAEKLQKEFKERWNRFKEKYLKNDNNEQ